MARQYFGTDGIRGRVGVTPITPEFVLRLGFAAGKVLTQSYHSATTRPRVVIGKDTRVSGYMLESALEAGLSAAGVDVLLVGPMPTPAVAYLTKALRLQAGIMISASHNPYPDNGIKFFSEQGTKLADGVEMAIEEELLKSFTCLESQYLGRVKRIDDAPGRYIEFCKSTFPSQLDLKGLKLVVDCAHGATYHVAPLVFHELGAEVITMGNQPNGLNINDGVGATDPHALQQKVLLEQADLGIALDGDGDRLIMVDQQGRIYDGDELLFAIVKDQLVRHVFAGGVVGTLMTNLAVENAFVQLGVPFYRAKVGDRYVLEALLERGWMYGGENSGHILCLDKHSTGDGIVSALQVLAALTYQNASLSQWLGKLTLYPQKLINVPTPQGFKLTEEAAVWTVVKEAEQDLAQQGRVLLRSSGTEPVIRVMVEGQDVDRVNHWADTIAKQLVA
ncbi:MAG: phosphoglucosamine mutase [Ferrovum sp. 37-45-19]|uniref:phosphoglucosamine mutase n=1 Tax=Ferrovum sp. JA12 TaxID=1356299 RepID=UPI0007032F5E|nr:phosphoglucosamine mutase [Ferrovum sp. JA12]OYV79684.1 MAG: phosphoglucosamine mutase [Ferrovum sp. 21-44-67]OYV94334.1 MAG: phosphoglucosamine mutase [Ferrovum sp. 37-45-19]OZB32364.1 MAG: phosphoglucosamine mutase [Ferrovum sp. 34-44-207]HQT80589.1 phosphoglucosamine mutase [Ferrovaceae bacterium]KRH79678.1 phosphoglucosamine mutase [Ferrovum sp. JA12]